MDFYSNISKWPYRMLIMVNIVSQLADMRKSQLRVLNGDPDNEHLFPFAVVLGDKYSGVFHRGCTGSLISHTWAITAAHCIDFESPSIMLYGNLTASEKTGSISKVRKRIEHPYYQSISVVGVLPEIFPMHFPNIKQAQRRLFSQNDIGLILVEKVAFDKFAKISAVDHLSLIGHGAKYAGFGSVDIMDTESSYKAPLQVADAVITQCNKDGRHAKVICFYSKCKKVQESFYGDSGGPLMFDGKLVGVCSMALTYTAISPYLIWIQDTMRMHSTTGNL